MVIRPRQIGRRDDPATRERVESFRIRRKMQGVALAELARAAHLSNETALHPSAHDLDRLDVALCVLEGGGTLRAAREAVESVETWDSHADRDEPAPLRFEDAVTTDGFFCSLDRPATIVRQNSILGGF